MFLFLSFLAFLKLLFNILFFFYLLDNYKFFYNYTVLLVLLKRL